ncbi:uncharacterized protein LOC130715169 isoform X2 [Lotus japonicus]|nr:uncharacterized protein LOC130715169 isoform X2 [Lotus japonicus]
MFPVGEPSKPYALNLVFVDSEGVKIEACIKKNYLTKFRGEFSEGNVYKITYFGISENSGGFRASEHELKIFFNQRTRVVLEHCDVIPTLCLSLKNSTYIEATMGECDYLIDFIGLVAAVSREKQYVKSGKVTRKIELDLIDEKGIVRCALFGDYVDIVLEYLALERNGLPVLVVQLAKIKSFRGDIVIQNVMNGTKLLWNPNIPEAVSFRNGLVANGIDFNVPIGVIEGGVPYVPLEEDFLTMFPKKSIKELQSTAEEGVFVVFAKVSGLLDGERWFYQSCRCHKAVTIEDDMYYCGSCKTFVLEVIPRFRIKVEVCEGEETATFVLFDTDSQHILQKSCKDLVAVWKGKVVGEYPDAIKAIVGNEYLFKVEKEFDHGVKYDGSFKVKKICDNIAVIEKFKDNNAVQTPKKLIRETFVSKCDSGSNERSMGDNIADSSAELSEIGPSTASLDDISPVECSSVLSSVGSDIGHVASGPRASKRMRIRNIKYDV